MKYTVDSISKATGLAGSTIQRYAWSMKLGKIEGKKKIFTETEAKKLGLGAKKAISVNSGRPRANALPPAVKKDTPQMESKPPAAERRFLWGILGIRKKPKEKVSLLS